MRHYFQNDVSRRNTIHSSTLKRLLAEGAKDWGFSSSKSVLLLWAIPVVIVLFAVLAALMGKPAYKWYVSEDRFAEWMGVIFFGLAAIYCALVIKILRQNNMKTVSCLYMIVFVGLLFIIGEELSWGQRIFGWTTSEEFKQINRQGETNIHNIYGIRYAFKWGQELIGIYGSILPILYMKLDFFRRHKEFFSFVIPHFTLIPFFFPLFPWRIYRNLFDPPEEYSFVISEFNEVLELLLAVGFFLFMIFQYRRLKTDDI